MQLCLENDFPLLPRKQPGCLAMLLPSLPFPLVLWPALSPVHTGAELASPLHPWALPRGAKASHMGRLLTERMWATTPKVDPRSHAPHWVSYTDNHTLEESAAVSHAESIMHNLGNRDSAKALWRRASSQVCPPTELSHQKSEMLLSFWHSEQGFWGLLFWVQAPESHLEPLIFWGILLKVHKQGNSWHMWVQVCNKKPTVDLI